MTNDKFIRQWLQNPFPDRKHGNLLTINGVLYSYGKHYPLATVYRDVVLINAMESTRTTERHKTAVKLQAWHMTYDSIEVPHVLYGFNMAAVNYQYILNSAKACLQSATNARKLRYKESWYNSASELWRKAKLYKKTFGSGD